MVTVSNFTKPTDVAHNAFIFNHIHLLLEHIRQCAATRIFLMALHADPDAPAAGGTERHVQTLIQLLMERGHAVIVLFPQQNQTVCCRLYNQREKMVDVYFHQETLSGLLAWWEKWIDVLHVHHFLGWTENGLRALVNMNVARKLLTLHDFYAICPSINLLQAPQGEQFCGVEKDLSVCNRCLSGFHGYRHGTIEWYRQKNRAFLAQFDRVLLPSAMMKQYLHAALPQDHAFLTAACTVLPHDLSALLRMSSDSVCLAHEADKQLVVFIGAINLTKGYTHVMQAIPALRQQGFRVEIWGSVAAYHPHLSQAIIRPYRQPHELQALFHSFKPAYVVFPFQWAETFSYVFYEALLLGESTVPIVSSLGHPALVVSKEKIGLILPALNTETIVQTCKQASQEYEKLLAVKRHFVKELKAQSTSYVDRYLAIINDMVCNEPLPLSNVALNFTTLAEADYIRRQRDNRLRNQWRLFLTKFYLLIKLKIRHPQQLFYLANKAWRIFRQEGIKGIKNRLNRLFPSS